MPKQKHLIIGCGSAALSALKQIRGLGSEDQVKLVTMENTAPYSPMSLPYLLSGSKEESEIYLTDNDFFDKMNATLVLGTRVVKVVPQEKEVIYHNGERENYDRLLIASGSEPVIPAIKGLDGETFMGFHTLEDYHQLVKRLNHEKGVVVLGAGYVGMEVAEALSERGHQVTVLEKEKGVLPLSFDRVVGDYVSGIYKEKGIAIYTDTEVREIRKARDGLDIICTDGGTIQGDLMVTCVGVTSRISMLEGSGIKTNRGILVDHKMASNIDGIFAAGDVAESPSFLRGENGPSPILPSAVAQGKIAGSNMIGEEAFYDGWLPMNVYNFFGHLAMSLGDFDHSQGDEVLTEKDDDKKEFRKIVFRDNRLVGANFFNIELDGGVLQYLIRNKVHMGSHKKALLERPKEVSLWLMHEAEKRGTTPLEH